MKKSELIGKIAEKANLKKEDAKNALQAITESIAEALESNEKVSLIGFGTFSTKMRAERQGINPSNGEVITIPEKNVIKFKAGSDLETRVNK